MGRTGDRVSAGRGMHHGILDVVLLEALMTQAKKGKRAPGTCRPPSKFESGLANLRSRDESVRQEAREALTSMGKPAVRRLIPLLNDPKDNVRW